MASRSTRLPPFSVLQADRATLNAMKDMHSFVPSDQRLSTEALIALEAALSEAELEAARAQRVIDAARSKLCQAAWAFHDRTVSVRLALKAQFGPDSDEVHAAGMTRASERKRPVRRAKAPTL